MNNFQFFRENLKICPWLTLYRMITIWSLNEIPLLVSMGKPIIAAATETVDSVLISRKV